MFHVGYAGHLDAKAVNNKANGDVTSHVMPKTRRVLTLIIASDGEEFLKEFVCKEAGLWEPVHTLANFDIYPSVGIDNFVEIVFVNYFLGKDIHAIGACSHSVPSGCSNRNWQGPCHRTMCRE